MMSALSQLFPLIRLSRLRRVPFWAQALAVCALFAIAGVAALDDYGMDVDALGPRRIAIATANYIVTGNTDVLYEGRSDFYYYGIAFETPLLLVERSLGLQDLRHIYLMRHLLTHLFFIAGGFMCGMLAYRTLGSRWAALMAMLLFLLHPRLYAHSFFNAKDIPFAALIVIALYLTHRAFRKDTFGAFLLCGIVAGLAINMRPFGLMLLPMIPATLAPDLWRVGKGARARILASTGAFLAGALATTYALQPYYWGNPLRFIELIPTLSKHPSALTNLFMGEIHPIEALPWNYFPTWFLITAPPLTLLIGAIGCAAVCWQGITRPLATLRDREMRFRVLLLGCFALPITAVIALQSNAYGGWRTMYFLWGPFCLLAAIGLHAIANSNVGKSRWKFAARLPGWVRGGGGLHMARRALAYGAAGVGLITTLTAMAALHPHQQVYFNALVDTDTPGELGKRYDMDYWHVAHRQSLEHLLARYPDSDLRVYPRNRNALILPQNDRERIVFSSPDEADFYLDSRVNRWNAAEPPALHSIQAYGSAIASVIDPNSDEYRDYYGAAYNDVAANGILLTRAESDIYAHNGALYYVKENCASLLANASDIRFFLNIFPVAAADLPAHRREFGHEYQKFKLTDRFALLDGKCVSRQPLPDYPIARIRTGRYAGDEDIWSVDIDLVVHAAARALYESIAAGDYGQPVAQSDFDVYLRGDTLAYIREPCEPGDAAARFFLHIFPADPADLPADGRESGFDNLDFQFTERGADIGGMCAASRELPGYAIERIRTGQFVSGEGRVWDVEFPAAR